MRRSSRAALASVAAACLLLGLAACGSGDAPDAGATDAPGSVAVSIDEVPEITSIWWQQSQAAVDFDYSAHTSDDARDIADLRELLAEHGVTGPFRFEHNDCESGLTTWLRYTTTDGEEVALATNSCDGATPFENALNDLVSGWRTR